MNADGVGVDQITTKSCAIRWKAPEKGIFAVKLIASRQNNVVFEFQRNVRFIDYWVVAVGDSFSSGEGNPDKAKNETIAGRADWLSEKCHRSKKSWPYKIYEKLLHYTRNRFAVHFTFLACTGASIDSGLLPILSQLDTVEAIRKLNGNGPELLMLSAGGNDVGFTSVINQLLHKRSLSASRITLRLLFVEQQLRRLAKRLKDEIKPSQVIIPTYFQFANNEEGKLDTKCADLAQMTKRDLRFAESRILQRLNEMIETKAHEYGWTAIPEVTELFDKAGLCAKNPLIRTSLDSIQLQGDTSGALHPTNEAHSQIADLIFSKLNFRDFIPN
ncbi:hypothetical protein M3Y97_00065600 [Aphelenchoides bicaudatus]|nr:hypothetical protein M3Y97_00065600 [Aphelenchoides bicaudatus]